MIEFRKSNLTESSVSGKVIKGTKNKYGKYTYIF